MNKVIPALIAATLTTFVSANAGMYASDNAGNYTTWGSGAAGPVTQDSQGSGFGAWSFANTAVDGVFGSSSLDGGSGINSGNGKSWSLSAVSGQNAYASLNLGEPLALGQHITLRLQVPSVPYATFGVGFYDANGGSVFRLESSAGTYGSYYLMGTTEASSGVKVDTNPLLLDFSRTSGTGWTLSMNSRDLDSAGTRISIDGSRNISQIRFYNESYSSQSTLYFNDIAVVPEPAHYGLICAGGLIGIVVFQNIRKNRKQAALS